MFKHRFGVQLLQNSPLCSSTDKANIKFECSTKDTFTMRTCCTVKLKKRQKSAILYTYYKCFEGIKQFLNSFPIYRIDNNADVMSLNPCTAIFACQSLPTVRVHCTLPVNCTAHFFLLNWFSILGLRSEMRRAMWEVRAQSRRRRNWDSPYPSSAGECAPFGSGGRGTLAGERGGGRVTIPTRGQIMWFSVNIRTL